MNRSHGILVALLLTACGGTELTGPSRPVTAYTGQSTSLFDDGIDATAAGLPIDQGQSAANDRLFRDRVQRADAVLRVKAESISQRGEGAARSFVVTLNTLGPVVGKTNGFSRFDVIVARNNPSYGLVDHFDAKLVGKTFIAFVQGFRDADGSPVQHVHLAADSKEVADAAVDAYALGEIKN